ncbi:MAG: hypothetical protein A2138_17735 [Deltaproteobacteria bacterium RBG_16_71_12]|nr:MAG: hypothetical protein A2138_17735 [Deltaproteobacteria bacterium RBG_16_71_12]
MTRALEQRPGRCYKRRMPRILERDFVARHSFQRLATVDVQADPSLQAAGVAAADLDSNGAIEGDPELRSVYQKLLSLDAGATLQGGLDLDSPAVQPVYRALTARFAQRTGTEGTLGGNKLVDVPELAAVKDGAGVLERKAGVKQLGVGSIQDALLVAAAAYVTTTRTSSPSMTRSPSATWWPSSPAPTIRCCAPEPHRRQVVVTCSRRFMNGRLLVTCSTIQAARSARAMLAPLLNSLTMTTLPVFGPSVRRVGRTHIQSSPLWA